MSMERPRVCDKWDWRGCEAVEFDPEKLSGRATVGPLRLEADTILDYFHDGCAVDEILETFGMDQQWEKGAVEKILAFASARHFQPID